MRIRVFNSALGAIALLAACSSKSGAPAAIPATAVDAAFAPSIASRSPIKIVGTGTDNVLDGLVVSFMENAHVPNAQLAVSSHGKTAFSHAYTYEGFAASTTTTQTIMRLASNTKAWTSAAIYKLASDGKIDLNAKVFAYLGITKPLPAGAKVDPRVYDITIGQMVQSDSTAGWDADKSGYDPSFTMRQTARKLGLTRHINQTEYVRFQLKQKLQYKPGTHAAYCNFCFDVLGMVVAKASGMSFIQYLQSAIATPSGGGTIGISPTVGARLPGEVAQYYNDKKGLSAFYPTSNKLWPFPYGGDGGVLEVAQGDGGAATSAESMLALMSHYTIWGFGTPPPAGKGESRAGGIAGTETWAEQLPNGTNYAFDVNTNQYEYGSNPGVFQLLQERIERHLCKNARKCGAYNPR